MARTATIALLALIHAGYANAQAIEAKVDGKQYKLKLTGSGIDTHPVGFLTIDICAVSSYLEEGVKVYGPRELASVDKAKVIKIVLLRNFTGRQMSDGVMNVIRGNTGTTLKAELAQLAVFISATRATKGQEWIVTHVPGKGLHVQIGSRELFVASVPLSEAFWNGYLGTINAGEDLKLALCSRLPKKDAKK